LSLMLRLFDRASLIRTITPTTTMSVRGCSHYRVWLQPILITLITIWCCVIVWGGRFLDSSLTRVQLSLLFSGQGCCIIIIRGWRSNCWGFLVLLEVELCTTILGRILLVTVLRYKWTIISRSAV
jgi:hypothetical protein